MKKRLIAIFGTAAISLVMFAGAAPAAHATTEYCEHGETIVGSNGPDRLVGTNCDDTIYGLRGNDRIRGLYGEDLLLGGRGDDLISDPSDEGVIRGGRGWDTCVVHVDSQIEVLGCEDVIEV